MPKAEGVLRCGIGGYAVDSLLRTFDMKVACHERAVGPPEAGRQASRMVDQKFVSWNRIAGWLKSLQHLRAVA